ncbi:MAG: PIG-L family deacetylase, partial [Verrucomicrobiota bacterium]|nr:PIG-L family deacetylase [Verrucomicrobiota bacterium]
MRADRLDSPIQLNAATRVLFFAPHPDDESLAAGGLLQRAAAAHATVHVVFATNGENNPWPLRVVGKQWRISARDRQLWGERRMQEARDALDVLRIDGSAARFLGLPDQHITDLLLREPERLIHQIREVLRELQPTLLLAPAPFDLHPDHNAFNVLVQFALAAEEFRNIERLSYAVHTHGYHANCEPVALPLTPLEQRVKRLAILRHRTQMALSRRRFMAHVTHRELFWRAVAPPRETDVRHPVRAARSDAGGITVELERGKRAGSFARCMLCLAVEDAHGG